MPTSCMGSHWWTNGTSRRWSCHHVPMCLEGVVRLRLPEWGFVSVLSVLWSGRRPGEGCVCYLVLWLKPGFVVWSFIGAGRGWAFVLAPAVVQGVFTVLKLAIEWNEASDGKIPAPSPDSLYVLCCYLNSSEAETLNSFSAGLNVCTLVSGLWWNPRSFALGLLV